MPRKPATACANRRCPNLRPCPKHQRQADLARGTRQERGYGSEWERRRADYLAANPVCRLCPSTATVADHYPVSRRELVAQGVADPDTDHRLRPLCASCHGKETAVHQPGGWNAAR